MEKQSVPTADARKSFRLYFTVGIAESNKTEIRRGNF
jgi:hypothetical protein